ncbi:MAG TPA: DUF3341 domain-containing protein [Acetobacteraceae bacterium]|jgi:hypothetical protein|nr:DUF3341 domain-containing protein [Acetobacteraceae bacterium]
MIVASFAQEAGLVEAVRQCEAARVGPIETYTPAPLQGQSTASPIPLIILLAGLAAGAMSFLLQSYSAAVAFRFDIGGRPPVSWPSFVPTTFENAALIAIAAGFISFMAINRMPKLYEPVDEAAGMRGASRDRWVLRVASDNAAVVERAHALLRDLNPILVEELPG